MQNINSNKLILISLIILSFIGIYLGCKSSKDVVSGDVAQAVYVAPGTYDEFYLFTSGGFNGQVGVYGLPSG
jgi:nitrous-oxide reductase